MTARRVRADFPGLDGCRMAIVRTWNPCVPLLIDIDGVFTVSWQPLPGAVEALQEVREAGLAVALVTNTTSRTRASIAATLSDAGFPVDAANILTAPAVTAAHLAEHRSPGYW